MPAPRRHLLSACVLAATAAASVLSPATADGAASASSYSTSAVRATNAKRDGHDLGTLARDRCLQRKAARQAGRMAAREEMFHQDLGPVLRDCAMDRVGENVAEGFDSGKAVVRAWMHSPGHRANILDGRYTCIGLAARRGADGRWYVSQVFGHPA